MAERNVGDRMNCLTLLLGWKGSLGETINVNAVDQVMMMMVVVVVVVVKMIMTMLMMMVMNFMISIVMINRKETHLFTMLLNLVI